MSTGVNNYFNSFSSIDDFNDFSTENFRSNELKYEKFFFFFFNICYELLNILTFQTGCEFEQKYLF